VFLFAPPENDGVFSGPFGWSTLFGDGSQRQLQNHFALMLAILYGTAID